MRFATLFLCLFCSSLALANTEKYRLMLRDDPATTIVVGWNQTSGSNPVVYYGTTDHGTNWSAYPNSKTVSRSANHKAMNNQFARITGLQPNTAYYFVIRDSQGTSPRFWFKTAPDNPNERLAFIAGGDSRNNRTPRQNANRLVAKLKPHAVLFGGDMTDNGSNSQWNNWFNDWQLTTASDGRMFPIVATRGNHEGSNTDLVNLFDVPSSSVYYALTFGGDLVRTYTLNTEISISGSQTTWLSNDLSANGNVTWKMAQYHKPMRPHVSSKSEGNNQYNNWANLFYNHNVKLVVECDAHTVKTTWPVRPSTGGGSDEGFIRDDANGTVYVGEGCWGAPLRSNNDGKNWTRNSGQFNQFKWIFVDQSKIETRTIRVDNASSVGEVPNNNPFAIPSNLDIWSPSNGSVVTILNNNVTPPTVSLTAPADGASYSAPQSITISANASDADGAIDRVEFYVNGSLIGTDNTSPYSRSYSIPADGAYTIGAKAYDNDGNSTDATPRSISVGSFLQIFEKRINASMDDVEENANGSMYTNSSDLELVADGSRGNQVIGMRFTGITVPQGATIDRAYVQFTTDETNSGTTNLTIRAHDTNDAAAFTTSTNNVSNRTKTSASVAWNPPSWSSVGQAGSGQRTPELKAVVQEVVNRSGWASGNDIVIIITGTGERTAEAYDGTSSQAPLLHIEYTVGGSGPVVVPAPSGLSASATSSSSINLSWTDNSSGEDGFRIERRIGSGSWSVIATAATGSTSYTDNGLATSTTYSYRIQAFIGSDNSAYSNTATATTHAASSLCLTPSNADESFESNFGNWNNTTGDDINWTRRSGTTPSNNTGPSGAFDGTYYCYIEASSPNYPSKVANLVSDCMDFSGASNPTLNFNYHMLGNSVGTLNVQARSNGGAWNTLWTRSGSQGSSWNSASVSLSAYAGATDVELRFNGTTSSSWQGDIVIDNLSITEGGGPSGTNCTTSSSDGFESSSSWSNTTDDDINWTTRSGSTPSRDTGPSSAQSGSYYIYVESSNPNYPSKVANLVSDCYDLTQVSNPQISFYYHIYGGSVGTIRLQARSNGGSWTTLWSLSGNQGNSWQFDVVSLSSFAGSTEVELRFNATTGSSWQSDFALDNIVVGPGSGSTRFKRRIEGTEEHVNLGPEFGSEILIYPNPAFGDIQIRMNDIMTGGTMSIYSTDGRLILNRAIGTVNDIITIGDQDLNPGIYILKAKNGEEERTLRFVKN
ncbi:MAG: Ig-like domain-containing protein [Bacteroidota bacterium]